MSVLRLTLLSLLAVTLVGACGWVAFGSDWLRFRTLRIPNITTLVGDGTKGWPEQAPFDRIIVTAAGEEVPEALVKQLRIGGVMVLPVGPADGIQKLLRIVRTENGHDATELADVRFVPLIPGKAAHL